VLHAGATDFAFIDQQILLHKGSTGVLVLDKGEEALLARAWLADHAQESIEVQYLEIIGDRPRFPLIIIRNLFRFEE